MPGRRTFRFFYAAAIVAVAAAAWACSARPMADRRPETSTEQAAVGCLQPAVGRDTNAPVLRIGTSGDYAPFSNAGSGFDIEVAEQMFADLGYGIEWVPFAWPELETSIAGNAFDVAMSGITWRPNRSAVGWMSRAVAMGGPCVLSRRPAGVVAVNRSGVLERWARARFATEQIRTVDDNASLPLLLERGEVDAIVTDSFELTHFARNGWSAQCEPPRDRKVYWVSPARAAELGPRIDAWLAANEPRVRALRARFLAQDTSSSPVQHLVDLLARRLALMPSVAAYKRKHGLPIEDREREAAVLQRAVDAAGAEGLEPGSVRDLFAAQIALAKAVQRRAGDAEEMDLGSVLRPALSTLDERILAALAACAENLPNLQSEQLDLLVPLLESDERARLLTALRAVRTSPRRSRRCDGVWCPIAFCADNRLGPRLGAH